MFILKCYLLPVAWIRLNSTFKSTKLIAAQSIGYKLHISKAFTVRYTHCILSSFSNLTVYSIIITRGHLLADWFSLKAYSLALFTNFSSISTVSMKPKEQI